MFCVLAVFLPSFFMVGVGRQLFVPLSLAVAFSMVASYLLSSSLVPVFSTWLMKEGHRGEEQRGSVWAHPRSFYERYLVPHFGSLMAAGHWVSDASFRLRLFASSRESERRSFPDANAPLMRIRMRSANRYPH